ncbi:MAG: glycosyltransferase [Actinobacteria bacterium]|uniref:Unannotated protein n=1 Tax=freshwater metagenome TaxID=449393 RepID=A0A6J6EGH0_9ZZZZ|nr:glycosyltransferase [Actinomycetota bacterium]
MEDLEGMTRVAGVPVVVLAVPGGSIDPVPLADAVRRHHPDVTIVAVWAGDPQLHPADRGVTWFRPVLDERVLAGAEPDVAVWWVAARSSMALLHHGARRAVVLIAGSVGLLGAVPELFADGPPLVARLEEPPPVDGCWPTPDDLAAEGPVSPVVATLGPADLPLLERLAEQVSEKTSATRLLNDAARSAGIVPRMIPGVGAGAWRWDDVPARLIDLDGFDAEQPWVLDPRRTSPARVQVVGNPAVSSAVHLAAGQVVGRRRPLAAPGGLVLDARARAWIRDDPTAPAPWTTPGEFRAWLARRWWSDARRRPDLAHAFPPGPDGDRGFDRWCERAVLDDGAPLLVSPTCRIAEVSANLDTAAATETPHSIAPSAAPSEVTTVTVSHGVDVVGYFTRQLGLRDVAVQIAESLLAAGVPTAAVPVERSDSPLVTCGLPLVAAPSHSDRILVVTADQLGALRADAPAIFDPAARRIGYWFWEVQRIPRWMRDVATGLDEVWAVSTFVADALAAELTVPVRHVPLPIRRVTAPALDRSDVPLLAPFAGRFVFLVVFDHFSVAERKNPFGAIEAFRRAFAPDEGPVLLVKSINGDRRWPDHQRVLAAADGRDDVVVVDQPLPRDEHLGLIAGADALVSLHRSEGWGLHLGEAMWLGTPVIATRYSGNLDFMDDSTSLLIDAGVVPVSRSAGAYPSDAVWADPDLDAAAAAMRALVGDASLGRRLARAARDALEQQPTDRETGRILAELLGRGALVSS